MEKFEFTLKITTSDKQFPQFFEDIESETLEQTIEQAKTDYPDAISIEPWSDMSGEEERFMRNC